MAYLMVGDGPSRANTYNFPVTTVSFSHALDLVLAAQTKHAAIETDSKGFFVHVRVPDHVASKLKEIQGQVLPEDVERPDIDHVTLVYTKKALEDHPPDKVHAALEALRQLGERTAPIHGSIQGWAYFDGAGKNGKPATALVALFDAPGLDALHVDMARALADHGIEASTTHVFNPHITIGFLPQHGRAAKELPPISGEFTVDSVHVAARDHHEVPLTKAESLGQKAAKHAALPVTARDALVGAGLGGGLGALSGLLTGPQDQPLSRRVLLPAAMGAVGGGIVGATHHGARPSHTSDLVNALDQERFASLGARAAQESLRRGR